MVKQGPIADVLQQIVTGNLSTVIIAGHYCLSSSMTELSHEGDTEEACFALGAKLVASAHLKRLPSSLVLWINDIGICPEERGRIKQKYKIPINYLRILQSVDVAPESVKIIFESTIRNKASLLLRKVHGSHPHLFRKVSSTAPGLVRCVATSTCQIESEAKNAYVISGPNGEDLVVKEGPNPKCNLILATLFYDLYKANKPDKIINIFNDIYSYRVSLGIHVARTILDCPTPIFNLFCDGPCITSFDENFVAYKNPPEYSLMEQVSEI